MMDLDFILVHLDFFFFRRSQEDLLALMDAHISIAGLCHDKTRALQYLAGEAA